MRYLTTATAQNHPLPIFWPRTTILSESPRLNADACEERSEVGREKLDDAEDDEVLDEADRRYIGRGRVARWWAAVGGVTGPDTEPNDETDEMDDERLGGGLALCAATGAGVLMATGAVGRTRVIELGPATNFWPAGADTSFTGDETLSRSIAKPRRKAKEEEMRKREVC